MNIDTCWCLNEVGEAVGTPINHFMTRFHEHLLDVKVDDSFLGALVGSTWRLVTSIDAVASDPNGLDGEFFLVLTDNFRVGSVLVVVYIYFLFGAHSTMSKCILGVNQHAVVPHREKAIPKHFKRPMDARIIIVKEGEKIEIRTESNTCFSDSNVCFSLKTVLPRRVCFSAIHFRD
jgi:hypothetical protein